MVEKIPHLSHSLFKTKSPFLISRGKKGIFNKYFVLQSKLPVANDIPFVIQPHQTQHFFFVWTASEEQVLELMKGVDISEAYDHHGVGNKIIKLCSEGFHVYFTPCINLYHSVGHYPNE